MIDNDQLYAKSSFPLEPCSICGIEVPYFSLGHAIILQSVDSPFIDGKTIPQFEHLMTALWVCHQPVRPFTNTATLPLPRKWRRDSWLLQKLWLRNERRLLVEITKLYAFIQDAINYRPPVASKNEKICRTSTCPEFLPIKRTLMNHYGYSEAEVLNMPIQQAKWEHYGWLEHERALDFSTRADQDVIERALQPESLEWNQRMWAEAGKKLNERS